MTLCIHIRKSTGWNPKMEVDGLDDFCFQRGDFQVLVLLGCPGQEVRINGLFSPILIYGLY